MGEIPKKKQPLSILSLGAMAAVCLVNACTVPLLTGSPSSNLISRLAAAQLPCVTFPTLTGTQVPTIFACGINFETHLKYAFLWNPNKSILMGGTLLRLL